MSDIEVRFGKSFHPDARAAVAELAAQSGDIEPNALIFFCAPRYDLAALGEAIGNTFDCPAIGCTTAGEILGGAGYIEDSIVCAAIASDKLTMRPILIPDLRAFVDGADVEDLKRLDAADPRHSFVLFLIDGLSMLEEPTLARVNQALKDIPLVGASAGDGVDFRHTWVYHGGAFHENVAVLALFETTLPFMPLHIRHFDPTDERLVITDADVATRTVTEINGLPAVEEYARITGIATDNLTPQAFAIHPLMLRIGDDYYVRSIQKANPDGSLTFFCAIDIGLVLTMAKHSVSLAENLRAGLEKTRNIIPRPALIFGSDGVLRRFEMKQYGDLDEVGAVLARYPFVGFSSYGEQIGGLHVNHTLTALALGDGTP
ncbi:MAG: FIST C-terminal domain-containing protein [Candidatus Accumulibacter sp.]|jgi:hypothetical protein|nr:FIST C-terminal domain-containing protein [Accumulibacter sp.]